MSKEVAKSEIPLVPQVEAGALSQKDINDLAKAGIIPDRTPIEQVIIFARVCREHGLSPFTKEIYLVNYGGKYTAQTGIDGFRRRANETGQNLGCDDPKFDLKGDGTFKTAFDLKSENKKPQTCTVSVHRLVSGQKATFTHTAVFSEFSSGKNKWETMPFQMIAKVAEAFALRKGFSDKLKGLSIPEEQAAFEDAQVIPTASGETLNKEMFLDEIKVQVAQYKNVNDLLKFYKQNPQWQGDDEVTAIFTAQKEAIENGK
jgi:phage recombination protein Bet